MALEEKPTSPEESPQRREQARQATRIDVECRMRDGIVLGTILDATDCGVFCQPDVAFLRGWWVGARAILGRVDPEQQVILTFQPSPQAGKVRVPAQITWMGRSRRHGCQGFGLAFRTKVEDLSK